ASSPPSWPMSFASRRGREMASAILHFRLLTLIFEATRRVHRLWRLGRRFLQCRRALPHVFEMTLARHRLDEEVAHRPDQRIDPVWGESRSLTVKIRRERALLILKCRERADVVNAALLDRKSTRLNSSH